MYEFLADYLEQRVAERDHPGSPPPTGSPQRLRPPLPADPSFERKVDSITEASVAAATKGNHGNFGKHPGLKKMLRREGTFNIYDSGMHKSH